MKKSLLLSALALIYLLASCTKSNLSSADLKDAKSGDLITLKSGVVVEKKDTNYIWLGDILLSKTQLKALDEEGSFFSKKPAYIGPDTVVHPVYNIPLQPGTTIPRAFGIYPTPYNLWAMVRFRYADNLTADREYCARQAMLYWQATTNVRFYNATDQPTVDPVYGFPYPYIEFTNSTVNNSYVGRQGGKQIVNLAAFQSSFVAMHEIGHAIGLFHEQSRYNRDTYLNINLSNVPTSQQHNFDKETTNYYAIGSFDFNSVMLYGSYAFAINSAIPTMTKKDGSTFSQGQTLSTLDKSWGNTFYIPYIARSDTYSELDSIVYKPDGTVMTAQERVQFQAQLNNGNPTPPPNGRIPNVL